MKDLPYFDLLLEGGRRGEGMSRVFERHVHWGYWENPSSATRDPEEFRRAMERLDREVISACDMGRGQEVLDAGCGFGGTLAALDASGLGLRLTGLNIDARQLEVARELVPGAAFVEGDDAPLPFGDGSFDRVLAVECIFHFPSRLAFLREASRVLKPGGRLSLSDFVPTKPRKSQDFIARWIERGIRQGYGHFSEWDEGGYEQMAAAAGLRIVENRDVTRHTMPTYPALLALLKRGGGDDVLGTGRMAKATRLIKWLSKLGALRYRIVAFEKA